MLVFRILLVGLCTLSINLNRGGSARASDETPVWKLTHQGVERTAFVHRGSMQQGPAPLVLALHGSGQTVESLRRWLRFDATADREGLLVVYPEAIDKQWSYGRPIQDPMPTMHGETVDDVGFIRGLIDDLVRKKLADPTRVYVTGMSRGALMTYTLTCALADRIAAVAPLISAMTNFQRDDCRPARPVPMMVIAGTHDPGHWYEGVLASAGRLLSVPETMEFWRERNGCERVAAKDLPHRLPSDPTRIRLIQWSHCRADADLRLYRVDNGGHQLPSFEPISELTTARFGRRNHDIEAADAIWSFVSDEFAMDSLP